MLRLTAGAFGTLLLCAAFLFGWSITGGLDRGDLVRFVVHDSSPRVVSGQLQEKRLLESPLVFRLYVALLAPGANFTRRTHLLRYGLTPRELLQRLADLETTNRVSVTIPEGFSGKEIAQRLENRGVCSRLDFESAIFDSKWNKELGARNASLEGYLFPATYRLREDAPPGHVATRLLREALIRLERLERVAPDPAAVRLGFGRNEILTLASIIEKETAIPRERARVARAFYNRLLDKEGETKGRLQSDPTAGYGCQIDPLGAPSCREYKGLVTPDMLRDRANAYNTYRHVGLPPGPIANPGESAIEAALRPAPGNQLYFVADGKGGHIFTSTYEDHKKAVERLKKLRSDR